MNKVFLLFFLPCFLALTLYLGGISRPHAQNNQPENLEHIFSQLINTQKNKLADNGIHLEQDGNINIEQLESYQAVTLPAMTLHYPTGNKTKIGLIAINATPDKNNWKMSVALPTAISHSDENGNIIVQIDLQNQKMTTLWNGNSQKFTDIKGEYSNTLITLPRQKRRIKIGKVLLTRMFDITADNKADNKKDNTTMQTRLSDITLNTMQGDNVLTVDTLGASLMMVPSDNKPDTTDQTLDLFYKNLTYTNAQSIDAQTTPRDLQAHIVLNNLPLSDLLDIAYKAIEAQGKNAGMKQLVMLQTLMTLPGLLSTSGTTLKISNTGTTHPNHQTNIKADIKAEDNSALGVSGALSVTTTGLEQLIQNIKTTLQALKKENPERADYLSAQYSGLIKKLELLNKFSQHKNTDDNKTKEMRLNIAPDGSILVNGESLKNILLPVQIPQTQKNDAKADKTE